jgi:hypothetical protein
MKKILMILLPISLFVFSCGDVENGVDGLDGLNILVNTEVEPIGATCPSGGTKFTFGGDINGNGVLSVDEITSTTFICNGEDGNNGQDGLSNLSVSIVEWTSSDLNFTETNNPNNGDGRIYAQFYVNGITEDVINNGFVKVELSDNSDGPWYSLPWTLVDGDANDVNYIYTSYYTYAIGSNSGDGLVQVSWNCSFGRTESQWEEIPSLYEGYYKITTIGE